MTHQSGAHPPRIAAWLVDLFTSNEHAESIAGDLLEEFSAVESKSGVESARRWYWRQSAKTIGFLVSTGFRIAPWSTVGAVMGGCVLLWFGSSLPERAIVGFLDLRRHHVMPQHSRLDIYVFWLNTSILIGRLLFGLLIGWAVAIVAKEREMVATMTLGFLYGPLNTLVLLALIGGRLWAEYGWRMVPHLMVLAFGFPFMIVVGGAIVRATRVAMLRRSLDLCG
jgi:hypothetical protein